MLNITHFVDGQHTPASQRNQTIYDPATGETRGQVSLASHDEVSLAVTVAKNAYQTWSQVTPRRKLDHLYHLEHHFWNFGSL